MTATEISRHARKMSRARWANATEADRERVRENGRLGGRPSACGQCNNCANCKRRVKRQAKA